MSTKSHIDSLSLLALKVASNVFDLSSGLHHISIRDQIVRAQLLVRDLYRAVPGLDSILVVGAGPAGVAAALEAANRGVKEVVLVEAKDEPYKLFLGVTHRFIGPYMYEWPSPFATDQSYPEHQQTPWKGRATSPLRWKAKAPTTARRRFRVLRARLRLHLKSHTNPTLLVNVDRAYVQKFVKAFALYGARRGPKPPPFQPNPSAVSWPSMSLANTKISPRFVLLAAGMGEENVQLFPGSTCVGTAFWQSDNLRDPSTPNQQVAIFGGGDGALQDTLRALTRFDHPLQFLDHLERDPAVKTALGDVAATLIAMDRQNRQFDGWTAEGSAACTVDACCATVAAGLVAICPALSDRIRQGIRQGGGRVALFVRENHFGKAYLLNRFLVHLLCFVRQKGWAPSPAQPPQPLVDFEVHWGHEAVGHQMVANAPRNEITLRVNGASAAAPPKDRFDHVVVRYGIDRSTVPGAQMIQLSKRRSAQRTTLKRVELPFVAET